MMMLSVCLQQSGTHQLAGLGALRVERRWSDHPSIQGEDLHVWIPRTPAYYLLKERYADMHSVNTHVCL